MRGAAQQNQAVQYDANAYGAAVYQSLSVLGKGITDVADAVDFKDQLTADADAKNAESAYREVERTAMYDKDGGYLGATGSAALGENRKGAVTSLEDEREKIANGLSPRAKKAFMERTQQRVENVKDVTLKHEATEFKNYTISSTEASAQGYLDDALLSFDNDYKFQDNLNAAKTEITTVSQLNGEPPKVLEEKLERLESAAQEGRVLAYARRDPIAAYDYLTQNRDKIDPAQYNKLFDGLEPAYYAKMARDTVDSGGGVQGAPTGSNPRPVTTITYSNKGAVRDQKLSPQLTRTFSVLEKLGMGFEVTSGGQPTAEESDKRIGSTRHDHGDSADGYFTKNGKRLNWANEGDRRAIVEAITYLRAAGATGIGAGEGYMAEGMVHVGFGPKATWGARGDSEEAPQWLEDAVAAADGVDVGNLPPSQVGMTLSEAMEIEDPKLREATVREIEMRRSAYAADRAENKRVTTERVYSIIDEGGSPDDIPIELQIELGAQGMNDVFNIYERNQQGVDTNNEARHLELLDTSFNDPEAFRAMDLNEERVELSRATVLELKDLQQRMIAKEEERRRDANNPAAILKDADYKVADGFVVDAYLVASKVTSETKLTDDQQTEMAQIRNTMRREMEAFAEREGRKMSQGERSDLAQTLIAPVLLENPDDRFFNRARETRVGALPATRRPNDTAELQLDEEDVPIEEYIDVEQRLTDTLGRRPQPEEVVEQYENELLLSVGVNPSFTYGDIPATVRRDLITKLGITEEDELVAAYKSIALRTATSRTGGS